MQLFPKAQPHHSELRQAVRVFWETGVGGREKIDSGSGVLGLESGEQKRL